MNMYDVIFMYKYISMWINLMGNMLETCRYRMHSKIANLADQKSFCVYMSAVKLPPYPSGSEELHLHTQKRSKRCLEYLNFIFQAVCFNILLMFGIIPTNALVNCSAGVFSDPSNFLIENRCKDNSKKFMFCDLETQFKVL